ncbi:MAG: hypothetical protein KF812_10820 [Fimbriimonadaceae bacterium]|nr:hypothetical protein [Fimbriimonadaceae bacterium]
MTAEQVCEAVRAYLAPFQANPEPARRPGNRIAFSWPPHAVSHDFHVLPEQWTDSAILRIEDEETPVQIAHTDNGVFARSEKYWHEARGRTIDEVLVRLADGLQPLLDRQHAIADTLNWVGRFTATIRELDPASQVILLYCPDRDVGHEAMHEIEMHASTGCFGPALVEVLKDNSHPWRRCAQWCVLDMFEDLPSFFPAKEDQDAAVKAIGGLMWDAPDDHARAIYKAGVVLGGHVCTSAASQTLLGCLEAPSRVARRSAIHALFHTAEWMPELRDQILDKLRNHGATESDPLLRTFSYQIADDIEAGGVDHVVEPVFAEERVATF